MSPAGMEMNPEQMLAVTIQDRDLLVTAGAGTGKTTVLIERILYKLRQRLLPSLDEILVVTFTEKAAQEMKERLSREINQDPDLRPHLVQLPRAYLSTIHSFCGRLLREHFLVAGCDPGFRVLDEHGCTEALEEALRKTFHEWYRQDGTKLGKQFRSLVEMTGYDEDGEVLKRLVLQLHAYARATDDPDGYLERLLARMNAPTLEDLPWFDPMVRHLCRTWELALRLYRQAQDLARDAGLSTGRMTALIEALDAVPQSDLCDPRRQDGVIAGLIGNGTARSEDVFGIAVPSAPPRSKTIPGFPLFHEAAKAVWKDFTIRTLPWKADLLLKEAAEEHRSVEVLVSLLRETDARYSLYKKRNGFLDFSDLEIHAARLLRRHGSELGLNTRFREVLVDEFQDVNPLQNEILTRLSSPSGRFRVGDVKQSIYQFRLADPGIFLKEAGARTKAQAPSDKEKPDHKGAERADGAPKVKDDAPPGTDPLLIVLAENHRSRPPILRFTNQVFSSLFGDADIGSSYAEQSLIPGRKFHGPEIPVELHLLEKKGAPAEDPGEEESAVHWTGVQTTAYYTARRLIRLMETEQPRIPLANGEDRPARWGDVALLLRSQTHMDIFLEALQEAGIPAVRGAGGSLLEEEGVRDFRCLLSVIDNPRDDVALAALLRSPLFGLLDSQLLRLRLAWPEARGFLDAAAAAAYADDPAAAAGVFWPAAADPSSLLPWTGPPAEDLDQLLPLSLRRSLRQILDRIKRWRLLHAGLELTHFLSTLREEARVDASLLGRPDPARAKASLEKFIALARSYEEERGPSLHGFLSRISTLENAGGIEAVPNTADQEAAVRILSIHKAKGLEFPIVVLPQLEWMFRRDPRGSKIRIGKDWVGIRLLDADQWAQRDTAARQALAELQEERSRAEEARILYVALTRARERLILIGRPPSRKWEEPLPPLEGRALALEQRLRQSRSALDWILAALPWEEGCEDPGAEGLPAYSFSAIPLNVFRASARETTRALQQWIEERKPHLAPVDRIRPQGTPRKDLSPALREAVGRLARACPFPPLDRLDDLKGKYWVTELESLAARQRRLDLAEEGSGVWLPPDDRETGDSAEIAAQRGVIYHAALSRLDLTRVSPEALERQFADFSQAAWWQGIPRDEHMEQGIAAFFRTDLGRGLSSAAALDPPAAEREVTFSCKWPIGKLIAWLPGLARALEMDHRWKTEPWCSALDESWVLLQGRMDCLFRTDAGWILLDWKTDRVPDKLVAARVAAYTPQVQIYRDAATRLWGKVAGCWLVFLHKGTAVEVPAP